MFASDQLIVSKIENWQFWRVEMHFICYELGAVKLRKIETCCIISSWQEKLDCLRRSIILRREF